MSYLYNIRRRHIAGETIRRKSIETATISLPKNSYNYTGAPITPAVSVVLDGDLLVVNQDYFVNYTDNTSMGLATVTVTGTGNYYGTAYTTFYIISEAPVGWDNFDIAKTADTPDESYEISGLEAGNGSRIVSIGNGVIYTPAMPSSFNFIDLTTSETATSGSLGNVAAGGVSSDGMHFLSYRANTLWHAVAPSPGDVANLTFASTVGSVTTGGSRRWVISGDGRHVFMIGMFDYGSGGKVFRHDLTTPFDFSTMSASHDATISVGPATNNCYQDFCFSPDGRRMLWFNAGTVSVYILLTPWDVGSAEYIAGMHFTLTRPQDAAISVNPSGSTLYILDAGVVREYSLEKAESWGLGVELVDKDSPDGVGYLIDANAKQASDKRLDPQTIQVLPDGRLLFATYSQKQAYIWGFQDGHPFDVEYFKSAYDSKTPAELEDIESIQLTSDGSRGVYSTYRGGGAHLVGFTLSTPFDLSTISVVDSSEERDYAKAYTYGASFMSLTASGREIAVADRGYTEPDFSPDEVRHYSMNEPCKTSSVLYVASNSMQAAGPIYSGAQEFFPGGSFCISPDGKVLIVLGVGKYSGNHANSVTIQRHNFASFRRSSTLAAYRLWHVADSAYSNGISYTAVALNNDGTKMIVFVRKSPPVGQLDWHFAEYNLQGMEE